MRTSTSGLLFGVLLVVVGLLALVLAWGGHLRDLDIQAHGGLATGRVTGKAYSAPDDWAVAYTFALENGRRFAVPSRLVSEARWRKLQVGDPIAIHYAPDNPGRNFPTGEGATPLAPVLVGSLLGLVFASLGTLLIVASRKAAAPLQAPADEDGEAFVWRNHNAAYAWGFALVGLLFAAAMSHVLWRDGPPPGYPLPAIAAALALLWLFAVGLASYAASRPCLTVRLAGGTLCVVRRFPFRREEHRVACAEVVSARVVEARDDDGDPYFHARTSLADGAGLDLYEGHDQARALAVCERFNRALAAAQGEK